MLNKENAKQRFGSFVELAAVDRPFISRAEERRLLEHGLSRFGLDLDDAQGVLLNVARVRDIRVERDLDRRMLPVLERFGGRRRKIGKRRFKEAATIYRDFAGASLSEDEAKLRVKRIMEENGLRPRRAGLLFSRRWYNRVGKRKRGAADPVSLPDERVSV